MSADKEFLADTERAGALDGASPDRSEADAGLDLDDEVGATIDTSRTGPRPDGTGPTLDQDGKQAGRTASSASKPPAEDPRLVALRAQLAKAMARQPAKAKVLAATLAREFPAQYPADWLIQVYQALDRQLRVGQLIGQLQAAFVSAPAKAKELAATLAREFPAQFPHAWVVKVGAQIDAARRQRAEQERVAALVEQARAQWDRRPEEAKDTLRRALALRPRDAKFRRWAGGFIRQIDAFQDGLGLERTFTTRPSEAVAIAERMHRRDPGRYGAAWLGKVRSGVWKFQDAAWAARVSRDELAAWVGANAVEWDEVPDTVKNELAVRLGQMKRDQLLGRGGGGVRSSAALVGPSSDAQRAGLLDQVDDVSPTFQFTKPADLPAKRLDKAGQQLQGEADRVRSELIPVGPTSTDNPLLTGPGGNQPDLMTTLYNKAAIERATELQRSGTAYRDLASRLRAGTTTIAAERVLMEQDRKALTFELDKVTAALAQARKADDTKALAALESQASNLRVSIGGLTDVLARPDGVVPGAGKIASALDWVGPSWSAASPESQQVGTITRAIEYVTGTDKDPYSQGIGRALNEQAVGLLRFTSRISAFQAGVNLFIANLGAGVLPESFTIALTEASRAQQRQAVALKNAGTETTSGNDRSRMIAGDKLPLIDRLFSNEAVFEKPDQAVLAVAQPLLPSGVGVAAQVAIGTMQTVETFFATYGQRGSMREAMTAAGWAGLQNLAGAALGKFGVVGDVGGNIALVYAVGKARGLSREQLEEEIAWTLIGAGLSHASTKVAGGAAPSPVSAKTDAVLTALDGPSTTPRPREAAEVAGIDRAAVQVEGAVRAEQVVIEKLLDTQRRGGDTSPLLAELRAASEFTRRQRAVLQEAFRSTEVTPSKSTSVDPAPKPAPTADASALDAIYADPKADGITPAKTAAWLDKRVATLRAEHPALTKGLSDADLKVIAGYTSNDGMDVNRVLREPGLAPALQADAAVYRDLLDPALAKLPTFEGIVVRVATYDAATLARFEPGLVFTDPGYLSTSAAVTDKFQGNTFLEIEQTSGRRIDELSSKAGELEVLMPRGTTFEVVAVTRSIASDGTPVARIKVREVSGEAVRAAGKTAQTLVPPTPTQLSGIKITTPSAALGDGLATFGKAAAELDPSTLVSADAVDAALAKALLEIPTGLTPEATLAEIARRTDELADNAGPTSVGTCTYAALQTVIAAQKRGWQSEIVTVYGDAYVGSGDASLGTAPKPPVVDPEADPKVVEPAPAKESEKATQRFGHAIAKVMLPGGAEVFVSWGRVFGSLEEARLSNPSIKSWKAAASRTPYEYTMALLNENGYIRPETLKSQVAPGERNRTFDDNPDFSIEQHPWLRQGDVSAESLPILGHFKALGYTEVVALGVQSYTPAGLGLHKWLSPLKVSSVEQHLNGKRIATRWTVTVVQARTAAGEPIFGVIGADGALKTAARLDQAVRLSRIGDRVWWNRALVSESAVGVDDGTLGAYRDHFAEQGASVPPP